MPKAGEREGADRFFSSGTNALSLKDLGKRRIQLSEMKMGRQA